MRESRRKAPKQSKGAASVSSFGQSIQGCAFRKPVPTSYNQTQGCQSGQCSPSKTRPAHQKDSETEGASGKSSCDS